MGGAKKKYNYDWEAIEREYRTSQLTMAELSRLYGPSRSAIQKRSKGNPAKGIPAWKRDLSKQVRSEINAELISGEDSHSNTDAGKDLAVKRGVEVIRGHRVSLKEAWELFRLLSGELWGATTSIVEIEEFAKDLCADDSSEQRYNALMKAVSLPSRAGVFAKLTQSLEKIVKLEREAFNLDDKGDDGDTLAKQVLGMSTKEISARLKELECG